MTTLAHQPSAGTKKLQTPAWESAAFCYRAERLVVVDDDSIHYTGLARAVIIDMDARARFDHRVLDFLPGLVYVMDRLAQHVTDWINRRRFHDDRFPRREGRDRSIRGGRGGFGCR